MKYTVFTKIVWFDFSGPKYLLGAELTLEFVDTKYMFFKFPLN